MVQIPLPLATGKKWSGKYYKKKKISAVDCCTQVYQVDATMRPQPIE